MCQVGQLLGEIDAAALTQTTMVVFFSDHGWSLGENGDWKKFSLTGICQAIPKHIQLYLSRLHASSHIHSSLTCLCFALPTELGTRVPLIVKVPWLPHIAGTRTSALVELVDVMPTMGELAGLPPSAVPGI
jgi:iduronate 2-sulfatase